MKGSMKTVALIFIWGTILMVGSFVGLLVWIMNK